MSPQANQWNKTYVSEKKSGAINPASWLYMPVTISRKANNTKMLEI